MQTTENRVLFTKEMKETHTLLIPNMLPVHFRLISRIFENYGYHTAILSNGGKAVTEQGLKYVHNDACYPAVLVIGQFLDALNSGQYDPHKVALVLMQTGGGCRASNYISLLRKALERSGYDYIPVVSFNVAGLESNPGFKLTPGMLHRMLYGALYGDLLMCLANQCRPYEVNPGESDALMERWTVQLTEEMAQQKIHYAHIKENYRAIVRSFGEIPRRREEKPRVGVVGEIFVKFSPLGNNNLERFLLSEGAEVVMPGLLDFCLYCVYNGVLDAKLYGLRKAKAFVSDILCNFLIKKQRDVIEAIAEEGSFRPFTSFAVTREITRGYMGMGAKMGEGWLLTAEMLELIEQGVHNIVCAQPFGCLPNHIVGKGVMKRIREKHPEANIVAIDYDPGATQINQENRIKLMLANAKTHTPAEEKPAPVPQAAAAARKERVVQKKAAQSA